MNVDFDHKIVGLFGMGIGLQGVESVFSALTPFLKLLLLLSQVVIGILTAILLIKKLRKKK